MNSSTTLPARRAKPRPLDGAELETGLQRGVQCNSAFCNHDWIPQPDRTWACWKCGATKKESEK